MSSELSLSAAYDDGTEPPFDEMYKSEAYVKMIKEYQQWEDEEEAAEAAAKAAKGGEWTKPETNYYILLVVCNNLKLHIILKIHF
ncbi:MAG: hypothetical protein LBQ29_00415 [Acinetobacter sp.]|uniref:hypothetical protein n=1 Tax=Acinetobacter sp. TaxID=472 RepID=UPI0028318544|nr:hypothetical protein [Acinetobacter sp.]MDR2059847.1 hypothetical protein [Acinetobacter sp.]